MRVGLVGVPRLLAPLAGALASQDAEVTVYGCLQDAETPDRADDAGYRVVRMPGVVGRTAADLAPVLNDFARFLASEWETDRPDVVNADGWIHGVAAQLAADRTSIPTVQTLPRLGAVTGQRQSRIVGPPARSRLERLLAKSATRVAAACSEDVAELIRMGCPRSRTAVLPHGVDLEVFEPTGAKDERSAGFRVVTAVDDLLPYQGLEDLVCAVAKLPDAELVVVGGPAGADVATDPDANRLLAMAAHYGAAHVTVTGSLSPARRAEVLRSADAFAHPSWYDSQAVHVIEAMACGVPVVASEAGAMADVVVHEVTGVLVPPRAPARLREALSGMLHGGVLRDGMGLSGRTRARSCYSWERVAVQSLDLYRAAVGVPAVGARRVPVAAAAR